MGQEPLTLTLSPAEYRMVTRLRDLPDSPLRDQVLRLLDDLLDFARQPRCPELQADGAPCGNPAADCDQCRIVLGFLADLKGQLPRNDR